MKTGIVLAIVLHLGFILFGGLLFAPKAPDKSARTTVDLLASVAAPEKEAKKDKDKPADAEEKPSEDMKADQEKPPDAAEMMRNLELSAAAAAPALDTGSLESISAALNGASGVHGDFAQGFDFASGGRVGGMAKTVAFEGKSDAAFSLAEIDQKPRVAVQIAPIYPAEMRGKNVDGVVSVLFIVDPSGKVINQRAEKSSHAAFERPALEAVRQWKFEAAIKGGQRVACKMRVSIRFQRS